jgi:thiol:disulfide interchange protein
MALLFLIAAAPTFATVRPQRASDLPISVNVETYPAAISPGEKAWVAVSLVLASGWHVYGNPKGPGPGLPTSLEAVSLPTEVQAGPARFLQAEKVRESEFGPQEWVWAYRNRTTIYLPLSTGRDVTPGRHEIQLRLKALLCSESLCLPYHQDLAASLTVGSSPGSGATLPPALVEALRGTHPAEEQAGATPSLAEGRTGAARGEAAPAQLSQLPTLSPRPVHRILEVQGLMKAVIFALLAGLILNVMPCVLPVVSLKILSFVQDSQADRRRRIFMGLNFAAGIITVFLILAGLASFAGYGWGELFQKQAFLISMIAILVAMSLSLFDIFRFPVLRFAMRADAAVGERRYLGCFSRGMLATFLATPCSGPLLGGTMAWSLRQPPLLIFTIFVCMGLGMAAPYVILSLWPGTLRWIPRPGPWVVHFERLMGFAFLATVVYLLTIVSAGMRVWVVLFCLFLALGLYVWGQMTTLRDSNRRRLTVRALALLLVLLGWWLSFHVFPSTAPSESLASEEASAWEPYSPEKLLAAADHHRWVLVDFTADWCPNCILVERTTLRDSRLRRALRDHNALLLKADLTRDNPSAKLLLERMGSRSIPFLALFPPGEQFWHPFFVRDIYGPDDVLSVFAKPGGE